MSKKKRPVKENSSNDDIVIKLNDLDKALKELKVALDKSKKKQDQRRNDKK